MISQFYSKLRQLSAYFFKNQTTYQRFRDSLPGIHPFCSGGEMIPEIIEVSFESGQSTPVYNVSGDLRNIWFVRQLCMVKNEATFLCLQSKSSIESTHRNCGTNRVSGKKSLTISEYSYKKYRTCIYIFLQYNEKKQIKKKKKTKNTFLQL